MKQIDRPYVIVLNSLNPSDEETISLSKKLSEQYNVPVLPLNVETMSE